MTRQYRNLRAVLACSAVLAVTAVALVTVMIMMHGPVFFLFRSAGTGATPEDGGLAEDQGPGQPREPWAPVTATAPDGHRIAIRAPARTAWAGIAQYRGGRWAFLDYGPAFAPVEHAAAAQWNRYRALFESSWLIVPLTRAGP